LYCMAVLLAVHVHVLLFPPAQAAMNMSRMAP
jgi:hypothetical protein